jgi:hypothetical protein
MKYLLIFLLGCAHKKEYKLELPPSCVGMCHRHGNPYDFFYIKDDLYCQCNDGFIEKVVK